MNQRINSLYLVLGLLSAVVVQAEERTMGRPIPHAVLLAYTRDYELDMLVGQYDPKEKRWYPNLHAYTPPDLLTPFTLFGINGKITEVHINNSFKPVRDTNPWNWDASISPWDRSQTTVALAVSGVFPDDPQPTVAVARDDPDLVAAAVAFLKEKYLEVPAPRITQALQVDLNKDGRPVTVFCANSNNAALIDQEAAPVYNLVLARLDVNGQRITLPLRVRTSYKPAKRTVDEHQRYTGAPAYYQILAFSDIERNGHRLIAILNDDRYHGPEIDLYSITGVKVAHPLKARMVYF